MWVIRGAVSTIPYYAGYTKKRTSIMYHWTSDKGDAIQYKYWIMALITARCLLHNGITSNTHIERV